MADKEATVYIVDLGQTMADCNSGRNESDLDWAMGWVWDKISTTVASGRKTWVVGVVGLRTDETINQQNVNEGEGYENISVLQEIQAMQLPTLRKLQEQIRPSDSLYGDAISAVVIATDMIVKFCKHLKYKKQIYLVTDARGPIDDSEEDTSEIARKIKEVGVKLTILGVDFDDVDYGFKEEDKSKSKRKNEALLKRLSNECDGVFATLAEAIEELQLPRIKPVRPFKAYMGPLTLGDTAKYPDASISIQVERFFRTKEAKAAGGSTVVIKSEPNATQSTQTMSVDERDSAGAGADFAAVKNARTYKINDPDAPGGKRDVEFERLAKGYEYGRTAVDISETDLNTGIVKLDTVKSFSILGFVNAKTYRSYLNMGESNIVVASPYDEVARAKLSSLIHAVHELDSYALARIVLKDQKDPVLVLLVPNIEHDYECFYDVPLPFAEDVRNYPFPPLDKVITVSGATLTKHRHLPTNELSTAMSDYVDAMDISEYGRDEEGGPMEYAPFEDTFSPYIHRLNQAIRHRAVHSGEPLPDTPPILTKFSAPDEELVKGAKREIDQLVKVAEVKKVPPKTKGKRQRESAKPLSGLDVDALLFSGAQPQPTPAHRSGDTPSSGAAGLAAASSSSSAFPLVDPSNAIPTFKRAVASAASAAALEDAAAQMGAVVRALVSASLGDALYAQAAEDLAVLRDELVALEEPALYNAFAADLKRKLLDGELGGDRRHMWWEVRRLRLGLVDNVESEVSDVAPDEAAKFYTTR